MARIDYADLSSGDSKALADKIIAERGSILHLYRMLMQSTPVAEGWLNYLTAIRQKTSLDGAIREMVIMRIAHLNRAPYEADQHAPIALQEGMQQQQLDALAKQQIPADLFTQQQLDVLAYTDAMTLSIQVADCVFQAMQRHFSDREIVELTATVAAYNMVSRFLEALDIHSDDRPA